MSMNSELPRDMGKPYRCSCYLRIMTTALAGTASRCKQNARCRLL